MNKNKMSEWYKISIKGIPKSEKICIRYYIKNGFLKYIITLDHYGNYKLYTYENKQAVYTKYRSNNPLKLEKYIG